MKCTNFLFALLCLLVSCTMTFAADREISFEERFSFITTYSDLAVKEMHLTGIPASITMAQFILETNWGRADLFRKANASFGIKCKNEWTGDTFFKKDDDRDENGDLTDSCFRAYPSVKDAFTDHSNFLKNRSYYKPLFEINSKDYRNWAYGLKDCKYATDVKYPEKLIILIEEYGLHLYDYVVEVSPVLQKEETTPEVNFNRMRQNTYPSQNLVQTTPSYTLPATIESTEISVPVVNIPSYSYSEDFFSGEEILAEEEPIVAFASTTAPVQNERVAMKRETAYTIKSSDMRPASSF